MTDKQILKRIRQLARDECANYQGGICLETEERCHIINPNYPSVHDGAIDCDYFMDCVLPADWELNDIVWYAIWAEEDMWDGPNEDSDTLPDGMRRCAECQRPFTYTNNRQKYCRACAAKVKRKQDASRQQKHRKEL